MVTLWPINFTTISYREIMKESKFFHSFFISVQRTVLGTAFTTLVLVLFAYPLSKTRREFSGVNVFKWSAIFCMVFNGGTVPWYITMVNYGMIDSMIGLILCGGLPVFNLILIINFPLTAGFAGRGRGCRRRRAVADSFQHRGAVLGARARHHHSVHRRRLLERVLPGHGALQQ